MKLIESAVLQDGVIFTGRRHCNAFQYMRSLGIPIKPKPHCIQGFVTDEGKFVDREEGYKIAKENGQLKKPLIGSILTSEDLY